MLRGRDEGGPALHLTKTGSYPVTAGLLAMAAADVVHGWPAYRIQQTRRKEEASARAAATLPPASAFVSRSIAVQRLSTRHLPSEPLGPLSYPPR